MTASASAAGSSGGTITPRLGRHHVAVPVDVRGDDRRRARECAREHHAEALAAERRRDERLCRQQLGRQVVLAQEAEDVDPVVGARARARAAGARRAGRRPTTRSRCARAAADLGPRAQQHRQPLAAVVAADEDDAVLAPGPASARGRDQDAVGHDLVLAREVARCADSRACVGDGDPVVEPVHQEAPHRLGEPQPAELAGRVERRDDGPVAERERGDAGRPASSARAGAGRRTARARGTGGSGRWRAG